MPALEAHGIAVDLPRGFEGRIFIRRPLTGVAYPVAQFATFPLPAEVGDFGGGAVDLMAPGDVFVALFEYGPESIGKRLFARQGRPTSLGANDFSPMTLRRGLPGQSGTQRFFTESGRPFTFYAVLGSHALRSSLVTKVNAILDSLTLQQPVPAMRPQGPTWN